MEVQTPSTYIRIRLHGLYLYVCVYTMMMSLSILKHVAGMCQIIIIDCAVCSIKYSIITYSMQWIAWYIVKVKQSHLQAWTGPEGSRTMRLPDFKTMAHEGGKVVSPTHWPPLPPRNIPGTHFC